VTVKLALLVATSAGAAIVVSVAVVALTWALILPLFAPFGTVAVRLVADLTTNFAVRTLPNQIAFTGLLLLVKWVPVIVTLVPTGPLAGVNFVIEGVGDPPVANALPAGTIKKIRTTQASEIDRPRVRGDWVGLRIAFLLHFAFVGQMTF
jgi:hypothetical protein